VRNTTTEPLWVTPIARLHSETLVPPMFSGPVPLIPAEQTTDLPVAPGESLPVHYDWDDCNLEQLLLRRADGGLRAQLLDPDAGGGCCYPARSDAYVVGDVEALPLPEPRALDARHAAAFAPRPPWRGMFAASLLFIALSVVLGYFGWRRQKR